MTDFYELQERSDDRELLKVLDNLINNWEYEVVEFKEAQRRNLHINL